MPKKNGNEPIIAADALASLDNALILSESFFLSRNRSDNPSSVSAKLPPVFLLND